MLEVGSLAPFDDQVIGADVDDIRARAVRPSHVYSSTPPDRVFLLGKRIPVQLRTLRLAAHSLIPEVRQDQMALGPIRRRHVLGFEVVPGSGLVFSPGPTE